MDIGSCSYGPGTRGWQNTGQHTMTSGEIQLKSIISALAVLLAAGALLVQAGCTEAEKAPAAENPAPAAAIPAGMIRGRVLETLDSGGYTYVLVETSQDPIWAAGPQTTVKVDDTVEISQGMPMHEFQSKTLDRTFDVLYFVNSIAVIGDVSVAEIEPGKNIAWVYANKDTLASEAISLRGKVVKYNSNILGWNFIHIQDGSGDATERNNDLTVTSKATTAVGETVVVTGTVILDKDLGAGYKFPVLIEDATVTTE